ncbi:SDR family oxidoreductase [Xanthovirga aplysinae]|uniref:SDR family oxidoreductase n=1 Tax=Xanthovirga aplysinae TaxID=2529853 RepID=UPI0012BBDEC0|nr:SDR family oxidoreductase [Xanthovirga aplysinae]MTI31336.1 SDR family oxidoreductase [Xanthovirga aplysinae]
MKKTILITGASTGIGRATANLFVEKGWNVAATMRTPEKAEGLIESESLLKLKMDVQDKESIKQSVKEAIQAFGKIDVLLNNAGYGAMGPMEAASDEQIRRQFNVNVFGLIDVTKALLPHMRANKEGLILNVSSIGGRVTMPEFSLYHATKWAVEGLTESLQYELNPLGIKLKLIEPGGVDTDFAGRSLDAFDLEKWKEYKPVADKITQYFKAGQEGDRSIPSTAEQMAEGIFKATTDGTDQLRYLLGEDALQIFEARKSLSDIEFKSMVNKRFNL